MDNRLSVLIVPVVVIVVLVVLVAVVAVIAVRRRGRSPVSSAPTRGVTAGTGLGASLRRIWGSPLGDSTWEALEEALLAADVGVEATRTIISAVRSSRPGTVDEARERLSVEVRRALGDHDRSLDLEGHPAVVLVVGVNGTGKTTTIAKLASRITSEGKSVVLAAGDTFRAAASTQLEEWGERLGIAVVSGQEGGDPASVAFDAIGSARAKGTDVVIVDTAGRLHAKKNLMAELAKIHRVSAGDRGEVDEVLLVLDATAGQNGIVQVEEFSTAIPVTGIVLTKMDGTARGGIVIAVEQSLGVPVKLVGTGEGPGDLVAFDPDRFVKELLEER